jgi:hypothetical protein
MKRVENSPRLAIHHRGFSERDAGSLPLRAFVCQKTGRGNQSSVSARVQGNWIGSSSVPRRAKRPPAERNPDFADANFRSPGRALSSLMGSGTMRRNLALWKTDRLVRFEWDGCTRHAAPPQHDDFERFGFSRAYRIKKVALREDGGLPGQENSGFQLGSQL